MKSAFIYTSILEGFISVVKSVTDDMQVVVADQSLIQDVQLSKTGKLLVRLKDDVKRLVEQRSTVLIVTRNIHVLTFIVYTDMIKVVFCNVVSGDTHIDLCNLLCGKTLLILKCSEAFQW